MNGMILTFKKKIQSLSDAMNNPISTEVDVNVEDCLVAPISEPANSREEQAMAQSIDQVRIHLPKSFTGDVSDSDVIYGGKVFHVDSDGVQLMDGNTPTRWNRYFRAQFVSNYVASSSIDFNSILTEDRLFFFRDETNHYYFAQEVVI